MLPRKLKHLGSIFMARFERFTLLSNGNERHTIGDLAVLFKGQDSTKRKRYHQIRKKSKKAKRLNPSPRMVQNGNEQKVAKIFKKKPGHARIKLEAHMSNLGKFFQRLWQATLASSLPRKDKAEILRLLILAFTIIAQTTLFIWLLALILNHG